MRLIDADALTEILKRNKQFFIKDKAQCDEIDNCIAEILTAPTIELDGDTISRQAVLDALEKSGYCYHFWIDIENIINSLPSAPNKNQHVQHVGCVDLISRQDAIASIKEEYFPSVDDYGEGYNEALNKAIWILEKWLPSAETPTVSEKHQLSEETPTNAPTDLISRQYVLYAIDYIEADEGLGMVDLREIVESLPTAEHKTGEWKVKRWHNRWMRKCSVCGWMQEIDTPKMQGWVYKYCPNCGAKMIKGGEDDTYE